MNNTKDYLNMLKFFAMLSFMEGMSFIVLLFIAMPLKYLMEIPILVKYVGAAHGLFFTVYIILLLYFFLQHKWQWKRIFLYSLAAILPFAPFWVHKQVSTEMATLKNK